MVIAPYSANAQKYKEENSEFKVGIVDKFFR